MPTGIAACFHCCWAWRPKSPAAVPLTAPAWARPAELSSAPSPGSSSSRDSGSATRCVLISTSDHYNSPAASSVFGTSGRHSETISNILVGHSRGRARGRTVGTPAPPPAGAGKLRASATGQQAPPTTQGGQAGNRQRICDTSTCGLTSPEAGSLLRLPCATSLRCTRSGRPDCPLTARQLR